MKRKSQWDSKTRSPIVEGPASEFSGMSADEVHDTGVPRLQQMFESDPVDRLRVIDNEGQLFDILDLGTSGVGVEPLSVVIQYLGIQPHLSWEEAQDSLPPEWNEYNRVRGCRLAAKLIDQVVGDL